MYTWETTPKVVKYNHPRILFYWIITVRVNLATLVKCKGGKMGESVGKDHLWYMSKRQGDP